jgi:hypothetical protein
MVGTSYADYPQGLQWPRFICNHFEAKFGTLIFEASTDLRGVAMRRELTYGSSGATGPRRNGRDAERCMPSRGWLQAAQLQVPFWGLTGLAVATAMAGDDYFGRNSQTGRFEAFWGASGRDIAKILGVV